MNKFHKHKHGGDILATAKKLKKSSLLPCEMWNNVFEHIPVEYIPSFKLTCKLFNLISVVQTKMIYKRRAFLSGFKMSIEYIQLLLSIGFKISIGAMKNAIQRGKLNLVKKIHENGGPWNVSSSFCAAYNGQIEILMYMRKEHCPCDEYTCSGAVLGGHLDCLTFLHENGCPWDEKICSEAVSGGYSNCLKYAIENGCPCDAYECYDIAQRNEEAQCLKYLRRKFWVHEL